MTRLCVPITATTPQAMIDDALRAVEAGADILELRLDYLDLSANVERLADAIEKIRSRDIPLVITCRVAEEGGNYRGDELARRCLLENLSPADSYIDLEYACWKQMPDRRVLHSALEKKLEGERWRLIANIKTSSNVERLILSSHDFEGTPSDLLSMMATISNEPCDVVKLVCRANSILDSLRMLDALRESLKRKPTIALSMGETGILTRVLAKKLGAFLTFASLEAGKESAPGQPTIAQMKSLYRWDKLSEKTKVYGVIGCPVAHSMSPAIHNAAFDATAYDGIYLPLRVEPAYEDFKAFMDAVIARPWLDLEGFSVTIPHKENLLRYVREHIETHGPQSGSIEPLAARIGVANTLVITPTGDINRARSASEGFVSPRRELSPTDRAHEADPAIQSEIGNQKSEIIPHSACSSPAAAGIPHLSIYNTDYAGALEALTQGMQITRDDLKDMRIAVLGAGGAARAIVVGLRDCGAIVYIYNRSGNKSRALAAEFGCISMPWESREMIDTEVIINCTSIGMWPAVDASPLNTEYIPPNSVVFDTIANPLETRLLREAKRRGCQTLSGVNMFINQAALQFKLWTGIEPPREVMRTVVIEKSAKR